MQFHILIWIPKYIPKPFSGLSNNWKINIQTHFILLPKEQFYVLERPGSKRYIKKELLKRNILRSEEHTSEVQSRENLVCRLLLEKKNNKSNNNYLVHME